MAAFIARTASDAATLLGCPTLCSRNRNCRFRLLFSMLSMSVTVTWPSSPVHMPIMARFLRNSQPSAPQPTMKVRADASRCCSALPNTEMMWSYRPPSGAPSATGSSGTTSRKSRCSHWFSGVNLPVSFTTSCATTPPNTVAIGCSSADAYSATSRTTASSTDSSDSAGGGIDVAPSFSFDASSFTSLASFTTSSAAALSPTAGRWPWAASKRPRARSAMCSCSARCHLAPSENMSMASPSGMGCCSDSFIARNLREKGTLTCVITPPRRYSVNLVVSPITSRYGSNTFFALRSPSLPSS
mmetsp:Transcript_29787/g.97491  ORF Transcript_29787/g.97491 Transcript_29787/m.97491 type:complete len:300 (+) Transcript_29787:2674-3573(+)